MGAPPGDLKGGKGYKGKPPAPKASPSKGKGPEDACQKGKGRGGVLAGSLPGKPDTGMIWLRQARSQHEDGHWEGDPFLSAYPKGQEQEEFLAKCPALSTLMMLEIGKTFMRQILGHVTKQVHEVALGDGRSTSDDVKLTMVELSDEEKGAREAEHADFLDRSGIARDWEERAESWLSKSVPSAERAALDAHARNELTTKFKVWDGTPQASRKPNPTTDELRKREEIRAAKEVEMRAKEQALLAAQKERMDHYKSLVPADIHDVPWSAMKDFNLMSGGSGGVVLVDLGDSCVVLKAQGKTAANELLTQCVAEALHLPIAKVRVVKDGENELDEIRKGALKIANALKRVDGDREANMGLALVFSLGIISVGDGIYKVADEQELGEYIGVGVLEYVQGHPLMGLEGNSVMRAPSPALLSALGHLCAFDVLINNLDRVPLPLWQNEGNLGNVMVTCTGASLVGIDQQINLIVEGPGLEMYLEKVRKLVNDSKPGGQPSAIVAKLRQAMIENCGAELSDAAASLIIAGLHSGFEKIADAWKSGELKRSLEIGESVCFDRFIFDGPQVKNSAIPQLGTTDAMSEFVCKVAAQIASSLSQDIVA